MILGKAYLLGVWIWAPRHDFQEIILCFDRFGWITAKDKRRQKWCSDETFRQRNSIRVYEIGCPGAQDICLTSVDKYLPPHVSCPPCN
jgi:hypothetical protein